MHFAALRPWRTMNLTSLLSLTSIYLLSFTSSLAEVVMTLRLFSVPPTKFCTSLGLAEDDFAKQIAGNDPNMMGDWFCMQRSLVIQSMARAELHKILAYVWNSHFKIFFWLASFLPVLVVPRPRNQLHRRHCSIERIQHFLQPIRKQKSKRFWWRN